MNIFLASACFLPRFGGPARSVCGLADSLSCAGNHVGLWAPDQSALYTPFLSESSNVQRLSGCFQQATSEFGTVDLVHDSGIWLPHNHKIADFCFRHNLPRVVSSRGMLEPWSRRHKGLKKWIAWHFYQKRDLQTADAIHVTSPVEAATLSNLGFKTIWNVPNGIEFPPREFVRNNVDREQPLPPSGLRTVLFVGRLYPVKGLPLMLEAWARVRPEGWRFRIAGPDEGGHQKLLERLVSDFDLKKVVSIEGSLDTTEKWKAMHESDLFVCPSYTENFGLAIAEAMACGLPVIATQGTPWSILKETKAGWWVPSNVDAISNALQEATGSSLSELSQMGSISRHYVEEHFTWSRIGDFMLRHYRELMPS